MKKFVNLQIVLFIFLVVVSTSVLAQKPQTCKVSDNIGGKYKLKSESYTPGENKSLIITIKVKPAKFNKEDLTKIARRINETYCNENRVMAIILDSSFKSRTYDDLTPPPLYPLATRSIYVLDRKEKRENIMFLDKEGKRTDENKIELAKP